MLNIIKKKQKLNNSLLKTQRKTASCLGGGLVPADEALVSGEVVQFGQFGAQAVTLVVALVGQENSWNGPPITQRDLTRHRRGAEFVLFLNYRRVEPVLNKNYSSPVWFK